MLASRKWRLDLAMKNRRGHSKMAVGSHKNSKIPAQRGEVRTGLGANNRRCRDEGGGGEKTPAKLPKPEERKGTRYAGVRGGELGKDSK